MRSSKKTFFQKIYFASFFLIVLVLVFSLIANPKVYRIFTTEMSATANGVTFSEFTFIPILYLLFSYFVTGFLGAGMVNAFFRDTPIQKLTKWISGFFLGYLGMIAIARFSSLFFTGPWFYLSTLFVSLIMIFLLREKEAVSVTTLLRTLSVGFCSLLFLLAALLIQVSQAEFSWVGHGPKQYATHLIDWYQHVGMHFPIILQHYDELLFHYWATYFFISGPNPIIAWWFTLALIKLSLFCFIYSYFRKLNVAYVASVIFTLFLFFGTLSPLATKYFLLFDSSNPLFFTVHSGRVVGIGVALFLLGKFIDKKEKEKEKEKNELLLFILIALGLVSTSLSNVIDVLLLVALFLWFEKNKNKNEMRELTKILILPILMVLFSLWMYPAIYVNKIPREFLDLQFIVGIFYFFFFLKRMKNCFSGGSGSSKNKVFLFKWFLFIVLVSLIFLGNGLAGLFYRMPIQNALMSHGFPVVSLSHDLMNVRAHGIFKIFGEYREIANYSVYCSSVYSFSACYGLLLILVLLTGMVFIRQIQHKEKFSLIENRLIAVFLGCLAILPPFFFFIDYVGIGQRAWIKTRFLEIPVYLLLLLSFYFLYRYSRGIEKRIGAILLLLYIIVPFISTERSLQMYRNFEVITTLKN